MKSTIRETVDALSLIMANKGKLVEAGWISYQLLVLQPDAPQLQLDECKMAFMAGAQHLFSSIMTILDPGEEPTEADLRKMDLIHKELATFAEQLELKLSDAKGTA